MSTSYENSYITLVQTLIAGNWITCRTIVFCKLNRPSAMVTYNFARHSMRIIILKHSATISIMFWAIVQTENNGSFSAATHSKLRRCSTPREPRIFQGPTDTIFIFMKISETWVKYSGKC
ncbi:hypothetical protein V1508DRAFT_44736 [Lipomyces doorenjongii]|uniref:uncharacterized protein n=1 Tax=Lipomyces doorenjongii TaxID=383834 RepID=UPI0034CD64A0